ncbi:MAG: hypothetical protein KUG69_15345 [Marinosulfonomonas sp.]|nr:hypothetical protein [Marinosulfonomonas sp.]
MSDHMVVDRLDGLVVAGPVGSEDRQVTAAWDYRRREICVRAGCWYGSLTELSARIKPGGGSGWDDDAAKRFRRQYGAVIELAALIPEPDVWPDPPDVGVVAVDGAG